MSAKKVQYARKEITQKQLAELITETGVQGTHWEFHRQLKQKEIAAFYKAAGEAGLASLVESSGLPAGSFGCPSFQTVLREPKVEIHYAPDVSVDTILANGFYKGEASETRNSVTLIDVSPTSARRTKFAATLRVNVINPSPQYELIQELFEKF